MGVGNVAAHAKGAGQRASARSVGLDFEVFAGRLAGHAVVQAGHIVILREWQVIDVQRRAQVGVGV